MKKLTSKETKNVLFEILKYLSYLFDKNNLNYSLAYGTLIGAARHKGFIPWDDDIDIVMPAKDYLKILRLPELNNSNSKYLLHFAGNEKKNREKYNYPFAKIEDSTTKCIFKYSNDKGGAFVDIFPMTPLPLNNSQNYSKRLESLHDSLAFTYLRGNNEFKNIIHLLTSPFYRIPRNKIISLAFEYIDSDSTLVTDGTWGNDRLKDAVPKYWFESYKKIEFEGAEFSVISNYNQWLTKLYGNWQQLPPVSQRVSHHYYDLYQL